MQFRFLVVKCAGPLFQLSRRGRSGTMPGLPVPGATARPDQTRCTRLALVPFSQESCTNQ